MNSAPSTATSRRHVWRWVLLGAGICLAPFVILGTVALNCLTLDRDVRLLREHVMAATDAGWTTKVQVSVGRFTLGMIGQGLRFVQHENMADARLALRAVRQASVGVYERSCGGAHWSRQELLVRTDQAMKKRGWSRLVGVADQNETVLIYTPRDVDEDSPIHLCIAVVNGQQLVVASTRIDASALGELVARHTGDDVKARLHFAKFRF